MSEDWRVTIADLEARRAAARAMGGDDRLARHRDAGKLDARARVDALCDPGTFGEIGTLVGGPDAPADAIVAGSGLIGGRPVMIGAEDFTVLGGTIGPGSNAKRFRIAELARRDRVPLVMLLEGAGYRTEDSLMRRTAGERGGGRGPTDLIEQARCSGVVPVVTAVLGASAGHGALVVPMSDFSVMTPGASVFTAGPPVVKDATGEEVTKDALGGPSVAIDASGLVHNLAADDADALGQVRTFLSFLPSSAWSYPPSRETTDGERGCDDLLDVVPRDGRKVYDVRRVLGVVFDRDVVPFEIQPRFGRAIVCALAHLGGEPVAVVANQPKVMAGSIDAAAADKAARFVSMADAFHLPLVFVSDNPGVLPGAASERAGVLRAGARMFAAQSRAQSPKLHVTLRKAYGFGSMVMSMVGFDGQSATCAWPGATLGAMGASAHASATGAGDDAGAVDALRAAELDASYRSARGLGFDELIDPRQTRNHLLGALRRALSRRQEPASPVARFGSVF